MHKPQPKNFDQQKNFYKSDVKQKKKIFKSFNYNIISNSTDKRKNVENEGISFPNNEGIVFQNKEIILSGRSTGHCQNIKTPGLKFKNLNQENILKLVELGELLEENLLTKKNRELPPSNKNVSPNIYKSKYLIFNIETLISINLENFIRLLKDPKYYWSYK